MGFLDNNLIFSAAQTPTSLGTTAATTDLNLVTGGDSIQWPPVVNVVTNTALSSGGAATVQVDVLTDSTSAFASPVTLMSQPAQAITAVAAAGSKILQAKLPTGCKQYLRVVYTIGTAALTSGKFDAYLTMASSKTNIKNS